MNVKLHRNNNLEQGLSLIELMIVAAIIGILAALSIPRFQQFQAKARQTEAKQNLAAIYTLQNSYYADNDDYFRFSLNTAGGRVAFAGYGIENPLDSNPVTNCNLENGIGFKITDCRKVRYRYSLLGFGLAPVFEARASTGSSRFLPPFSKNLVFPGCEVTDVWSIDTGRYLNNIPSPFGSRAIDVCL